MKFGRCAKECARCAARGCAEPAAPRPHLSHCAYCPSICGVGCWPLAHALESSLLASGSRRQGRVADMIDNLSEQLRREFKNPGLSIRRGERVRIWGRGPGAEFQLQRTAALAGAQLDGELVAMVGKAVLRAVFIAARDPRNRPQFAQPI